MPITEEFKEKHNLSDEQIAAVNEYIEQVETPTIQKQFNDKANKDAEAILDGAAKAVERVTGVKREKGQKIADYFTTAGSSYVDNTLAKEKENLEAEKKRYEKAIKDGGNDHLKEQLEETKNKLEELKKNEATYKELIEGDYKSKYEQLVENNKQLKDKTAFNMVKPSFPETVNKYEADAKWKEFESNISKEYNIVFDGDTPMAVSKENEYISKKLSDLVAKDETLSELLKGRQQRGTGARTGTKKLEGVPFDLPDDNDPQKVRQAIADYVLEHEAKGKGTASPEFAQAFAKYNVLIRQKTATN